MESCLLLQYKTQQALSKGMNEKWEIWKVRIKDKISITGISTFLNFPVLEKYVAIQKEPGIITVTISTCPACV